MTRTVEFSTFVGLALLIHAGLFYQFEPQGVQSQGADGQEIVSLMASSAQLADTVSSWNRPVEVQAEDPAALQAYNISATETPAQTSLPSVETVKRPTISQLSQSLAPMAPMALPNIDTQSPEPRRHAQAPATSPRPTARPKKQARPTDAPPKPQAKSSSSALKPQRAKDGQTGQNAGASQERQSATLSKAKRSSLLAKWGASIRTRVERNKRYPAGVRATGTTALRLTVSRTGRLLGVSVINSAGHRSLDQAALRAVRTARFRAAPDGLGQVQYTFNLALTFLRN